MLINHKGFTLVELMIVVAIVGILAAVAVPNFIAYRQKARIAQGVATAESIRGAIANYAADSKNNTYPTAAQMSDWPMFRTLCNANGTTLLANMEKQGYTYFKYHAIGKPPASTLDTCDNMAGGEECADYEIIFHALGVPNNIVGSQISVSPSGIIRQTW